jgi:ketosteroid isomerase-like protein
MISHVVLFAILLLAPPQDPRAADRAAIRAHIESIFEAFINHDVDKIYATHSEDWVGFLPYNDKPIRGIDDYMRANGIDWPKEKGAKPKSDGRQYGMKDFQVTFHTPDLALAHFVGWFERKEGDKAEIIWQMRISDTYARRQGKWIQVASHTEVDPEWMDEDRSKPASVSPEMRKQILTARDAVWKAWFSNDRAALEKLVPTDVIAIENSPEWSHRTEIFEGSKAFSTSGGKLLRLEFPKTEIQVYGNTAIVYTSYLYEIESSGKRTTQEGRGTEIFVMRGGQLVNVGWHLDSGPLK